MEKYFPTLQACPLFDGIGWADLLRMLSCLGARVIRFEKKDTVLAEGNAARYIGIVLTGSVQIIQIDYYGNRSIVLQAGPSAIFGEAFACAVAFTAAADLAGGAGETGISSFSAGEISVKKASAAQRSGAAKMLRQTAERLMAPFAEAENFCFRGVRG